MRFWCSQLFEPWTWTPRPYIGVWLCMAVMVVERRHQLHAAAGEMGVTRRQQVWFWLGLASFWLASDWPVGTLGAGYLASVHMSQYMLYTFVTAPLLLLSVPAWRMQGFVDRYRLTGAVRQLCRLVPAVVIANGVLIATHAPFTVDRLRSSQVGSFLLDVIWIIAGLLLWLPALSPVTDWRIRSVPVRSIYLFLAAQLTPLVPGGFLTFASAPLYATYELAPRVGLDPIDDQQLAGAIMKVGSLPFVWTVIAVWWIRWAAAERRAEPGYRVAAATRPPA